jgi:chemotaxis protein CheX
MSIRNADILTITQNVLETMANMSASDCSMPDTINMHERMTGCVQISGTWQGAVVVQTSEAFARQAASEMLRLEMHDVTDADMLDTLAELTNMIGGNIKSQVPGPSYLSIPSVTTGQDFDFRLKGAVVVNEMTMNCAHELLNVVVCEAQDETN